MDPTPPKPASTTPGSMPGGTPTPSSIFAPELTEGSALPDTGLGVPPRPPFPPPSPGATFKEPLMARPPFPATPAPSASTGGNPPMPASPRPAGPPGPLPARPSAMHTEPERRTLVVGRGISVQGSVQDAERLVVEGTVEATMIHAAELSVSHGGMFRGEVEVESAEIAGTIDGTVTARANLIVRATGIVLGTARCRRLQVEDGGQITGRIEMLSEAKSEG